MIALTRVVRFTLGDSSTQRKSESLGKERISEIPMGLLAQSQCPKADTTVSTTRNTNAARTAQKRSPMLRRSQKKNRKHNYANLRRSRPNSRRSTLTRTFNSFIFLNGYSSLIYKSVDTANPHRSLQMQRKSQKLHGEHSARFARPGSQSQASSSESCPEVRLSRTSPQHVNAQSRPPVLKPGVRKLGCS